jgi:hypothetical protein
VTPLAATVRRRFFFSGAGSQAGSAPVFRKPPPPERALPAFTRRKAGAVPADHPFPSGDTDRPAPPHSPSPRAGFARGSATSSGGIVPDAGGGPGDRGSADALRTHVTDPAVSPGPCHPENQEGTCQATPGVAGCARTGRALPRPSGGGTGQALALNRALAFLWRAVRRPRRALGPEAESPGTRALRGRGRSPSQGRDAPGSGVGRRGFFLQPPGAVPSAAPVLGVRGTGRRGGAGSESVPWDSRSPRNPPPSAATASAGRASLTGGRGRPPGNGPGRAARPLVPAAPRARGIP